MILLPDEDEEPVGAQVNAMIGNALRQSVADVEPSPGFAARLTAALDTLEQAGHSGRAAEDAAGQAADKNEQADGVTLGVRQGSKAEETAS